MLVQCKKVKCSITDINVGLVYIINVINYFVDQIKRKTMDDLKGWVAPLISYTTPQWIDLGVPIK